jgi:hypothetical protein
MSVSQMSARSSSVLSLLRELGRPPSAQPASGDANDLIKTAQGLSPAPGPAARQASGAAVIFNVTQAERDATRTAEAERERNWGPIILTIGQSKVTEQFDSWAAVEKRVRDDRTMTADEKSIQLASLKDTQEAMENMRNFRQSDLWIAMQSGEFERAVNVATEAEQAIEMAEIADLFKANISGPPVLSLSRNADA